MKFEQMDLFKSILPALEMNKETAQVIYLEIREHWQNKWMSQALEDIVKIVNQEKVNFKNERYKDFVYKIGGILKPDLLKNKGIAMKIIFDLGWLKSIQDDGHPISIDDCLEVPA